MRIILINIFILFILIVCLFTGTRTEKVNAAFLHETIRIAIVKNATGVTIDGDGILATRENGSAVLLSPPVKIKSTSNGIMVDGEIYRRLSFSAPSAVYINSKPYRGIAEVSFVDKGLLVVNELPLEDYLVGLINCEISSAWPMEAIKSQAVIARTYALNRKQNKKNAPYHMESTVIDQVYDGCLIEDSRARRGVTETAGEVLVFKGALIQSFYHSNCGGKTEAAENVWGASVPYLKGVDCQYCLTSGSSGWEQKMTLRDIEDKLKLAGYSVSGVSEIKAGPRNSRGRLKNVIIISARGDLTIAGDQFRKAIGYGVIKSTNFNIKFNNKEIVFNGLGNGHGVGLCQWGSKQRAQDGFSYQEILSYYYPGTAIMQYSEIQ